jgi:rubrerythrin
MEEVRAAWQAYNEGKGPRPDEERPIPTNAALKRRVAAAAREEAKRQWEAGRAEREARQRAEREAWDKEQAQRNAERAERQAKERIELDRMLAAANHSPDVDKFRAEEKRILDSKWSCTVCGGKSYIERKSPGYQLTCLGCGKQAWGSHKSLWEVLSK